MPPTPSPAKVARPILKNVLARTRLFDRLERWSDRRIIWVCGPAGCGKTTLVGSYLQDREGRVLWYQTDEGDRDPATFFYYLGLAAKAAAPRHQKPLPLLTPEYLPGLPTFCRRYFEAMSARLKPPAAIVFDNLHEVDASSDFYALLCAGLSRLPDGATAFLISRSEPPPVFARMVANREMVVLPWEELRLTPAETAQVVRMSSSEAPSSDELKSFHSVADGWIAGLLLVLEWARSERPETPTLHRQTPEQILDYFGDEVFRHLDPATQTFLLKTALLPRMTVKMAETLTEYPAGGSVLARLNRQNAFTERRFQHEAVYQYHPLFREFLLARGRSVFRPEELSALHRQAAALLEEKGETEQAAGVLCAAGDWQPLIAMIVKHAPRLLAQGRNRDLEDWLSRLPPEMVEATPWLLLWKGASLMPFRAAAARPVLERAFKEFKAHGDVAGIWLSWAGTVDAICYSYEDCTPLDWWIGELDELVGKLGRFPSPEIEARVATSMVTALVWRQPCRPDFDDWAARALSRRTPDAFMANLQTIWMVARRHYFAGDLGKVSSAHEQLLQMAQSQDTPPLAQIMVRISEARYFDQAGQHQECMTAALQGMDIAKREGIHILDEELLANAIIGALNMGDWKRARGWLDEMHASHSVQTRLKACLYNWLKTREALIRGDAREALRHSDLTVKDIGLAPAFLPSYAFLIRARALHALDRDVEAMACFEQAKREADKLASPLAEFGILMAEAEFQLTGGHEAEGLRTLGKALRCGKSGGYLNIEVDVPSATAKLCARALEAGIEVEYACELVRKRHLALDEPPYHLDAWPWPLKIHTLGDFRLQKDGEPISFSGKARRKPLLLLKALIALGGREIREEQVSDLLWPDADGDAGHSAFTTTLSRLRELLGLERAVRIHDGRASLDPRICWVDAWAFERVVADVERRLRALRTGRGQDSADLPALVGKACDLYRGHFLAEEAAQAWTASARERLRMKFLRVIVRWGEHLEDAAQWKDAVEYYRRGLELDELAEEFYQRLMVCYQRLGLRAEAIATYRLCCDTLAAGLGVAPSTRTEAIHRALRS